MSSVYAEPKQPDVVIKSYRKHASIEHLQLVSRVQNALAGAYQIPRILRFGYSESHPNGFLSMERMPGVPVRHDPTGVSSDLIDDLERHINGFQHVLDEIVPDWNQTIGGFYGQLHDLVARTNQILGSRNSQFRGYSEEILERITTNPLLNDRRTAASVVHFDLSEENILVSDRCLGGIVDFDSVQRGDASFDRHYALCHLLYAGASQEAIQKATGFIGREQAAHEMHVSRITSDFVALQNVMVLGKRTARIPERKNELVEHARSRIESHLDHAPYARIVEGALQ